MAKPTKVSAVAEITEEFRSSTAAVLTEYRGLTVAQLKALRVSLRGDATYAVVKNTLTKRAAREAGIEGLDDALKGPSAIAFVSGDPVTTAKRLRDFAKANPALVIKAGYMDGRVLTASDIIRLADLESREVLLSKLAGAMKASMSQAAALFVAPLSQAARTIEALRVKVAEGAPAPAATPASEPPAEESPAGESSADSTPEEAPAEASADAPEETPEG